MFRQRAISRVKLELKIEADHAMTITLITRVYGQADSTMEIHHALHAPDICEKNANLF